MSLDLEINNRDGGLAPLLEEALSRLLKAAPAGRHQEVIQIESLRVSVSGWSTRNEIAATTAAAIVSALRGGK